MAQIEKYFDGISEAIDAIADCLDEGALSRKDADQIQDILAEIKPTFIRKALRFHYGDSVLTLDTTARTPETLSLRPSQVVLLTKRQPRKAATFRFTTRRLP